MDRNPLCGHFAADGKARLEGRVVLPILAVVVEAERLARNIAADGLAEPRKASAAHFAFAFNVNTSDQHRFERLQLYRQVPAAEKLLLIIFPGDDFAQRSNDAPVLRHAFMEERSLPLKIIQDVRLVFAVAEYGG